MNFTGRICRLLVGSIVSIAALAVVSTAFAQTSVCNSTANLVTNCGFETGAITGWTTGGNTTNPPGAFNGSGYGVDARDANSGNGGLYMGPIGGAMSISQTLTLTANTQYSIVFYLRQNSAPVLNSNHTFTAAIDNATLSTTFASLLTLNNSSSAGSYVRYTYTFTPTNAQLGGSTGSAALLFSFRNDDDYWSFDDVSVQAPLAPSIAKAFNPATIQSGGTSVVTLTLSNGAASALTGGAFSDTLVNMSAVGGAVGGTCAGTTPTSLAAGATSLSFTGIVIPASGSCTVTFSVTSSTLGGQPNTTSGVTTTQTTTAGAASNTAMLTVSAVSDFSLSAAPPSQTVVQGGGTMYSATVTSSGGFNGTVTLGVSGLPSGAGANFTPPTVAGSGSSTMNVSTGTATPSGSYTLTITGTSGSLNHQTQVTLVVNSSASIAVAGGTPQSATVNAGFSTRLQAKISDAGNSPVSGVTVTFTAPGSGASGTFGSSAIVTANAVTNSSGVAIAPAFKANSTAGSYVVIASALGAAGTASFNLTNKAGAAASIAATGGTPQSATLSTAFATPLQATVSDAGNNPVSGVTVTFTAPASGASGTFAGGAATVNAVTNSSGVATATAFTANSMAGSYTVTASVPGVTATAAFSLTNNAGTGASIAATSGTPQSASVNTAFAMPLQATVRDAGNNPVSGVTVTFTAPASGVSGTFTNGTATANAVTNGSGVAMAQAFTANSTAGSYLVTAGTPGAAGTASFNLTNNAGTAASIAATGGTPQSATVNAAFATPLQATVRDAGNNPVSGVMVTFTAPASGASGTFAGGAGTVNAVTNGSGVATAPAFTANSTAGSYLVTAGTPGAGGAASFNLTNNAGTAASIAVTGGTPQSATISTAFATPLQATVKDAGNNPVSGVTVTFTAPASGASGTFAGGAGTVNAVTNGSGVATAPAFTANATAGSYTVTGSAPGATGTASFNLTNNAGAAASIAVAGGTPQSATVNSGFSTRLQAKVGDAGNNPLSGVTVTFTAPGSGASGTFTNGLAIANAVTNSSGVAIAPAFKANSTVGSYVATTSSPGAPGTASFNLTNKP
ncbi:MAG TPA: carbohydrate binding domain-containing protein [Bryobacteraceae bacterium]|jgi:hypothetical protein